MSASSRLRYFINNLPDYAGGDVQIPSDLIKARCLDKIKHIFSRQTTTFDDCDGGLYVGLAGVSYMCYYLSQLSAFQDSSDQLLIKSEEYLKPALAYVEHPRNKADSSTQASFLLGTSGVFALTAAVMNSMGRTQERDQYIKNYNDLADKCLPINFLRCGSDELFVGRAGYLCGLRFLWKTFGNTNMSEEKIFGLCQSIVDSGIQYSRKVNSPCPLMYAYYDTEYLGAAHGLSSILQMLLCFDTYLDRNPESEQKIRSSVDFMLSLQTASGNFPCAMDEVGHQRREENELVHWCHGAPGVVYLMAQAYLRWKDSKYLQSCLACGEIIWKKGLLKKGPGICHGVAGSGYVFLLLYRLTNNNKHLHRAVQFANFMFEDEFKSARSPDRPLSLYEGLAGTVCFLADLLEPQRAHFPFFDVY